MFAPASGAHPPAAACKDGYGVSLQIDPFRQAREIAGAQPFEIGLQALRVGIALQPGHFRAQKPLEWDAKQVRITNAPEAEKFLDQERREGWGV